MDVPIFTYLPELGVLPTQKPEALKTIFWIAGASSSLKGWKPCLQEHQ
jgi:hypothetical protein